MWEFYLAGSETSFRVDGHMVFQIQIAKRQDAVPLTRDYIVEREAELRSREAARLPSGRRPSETERGRTDSIRAERRQQ